MRKPRILLSTTVAVSSVLIKGQCNFLRDAGFDVFVLSADGTEMRILCAEEKAEFIPIPLTREISFLNDLISLFFAIKSLVKIRPKIVNAGTPKAGFILMLAAFFTFVPHRVFTLHGLRSTTLKGVKKRLVVLTEKVSCMLAHEVISVSSSLKEEVVAAGIVKANKCRVLLKGSCNGVDVTKFNRENVNLFDVDEKRIKFNLKENQVVIGFVGRLVKEKGVMELYETFLKVKEKYNVKLIIIGPEEADDRIPAEILTCLKEDDSIVLTGRVSNVQNYLPLFDFLVLPSYREGFGNVIIESAAMGIPTIASDIAGCKDAIEANITGLLFKPKSVKDLEDKIKIYIEYPNVKIEHGQHAKERVIKYFSNEAVWNAQLSFYQELLSKKKGKINNKREFSYV